MRITHYSIFLFLLVVAPAFAQVSQLDHPDIPVDTHFYQCTAHFGTSKDDNMPDYESDEGFIGLFQFGVVDAYEAGLCNNPVPLMRREQIWKLCDFQGPIARKYGISNQYDLRFDKNASKAQFEMMSNLVAQYDDYMYRHNYDQYFGQLINGTRITPDIIRGMLLFNGRAAVDEFLHGHSTKDSRANTFYSIAGCLRLCMLTDGKKWICN